MQRLYAYAATECSQSIFSSITTLRVEMYIRTRANSRAGEAARTMSVYHWILGTLTYTEFDCFAL